jgi:glycosyltransferase involved in cell wall biosynthesis
MGIAPMEYLRLGIPVLCTAAGGLVDVCEAAGPASRLLGKDASAEEIASELEILARSGALRQTMRDAAWKRKEHFRWERTVRELEQVWAG